MQPDKLADAGQTRLYGYLSSNRDLLSKTLGFSEDANSRVCQMWISWSGYYFSYSLIFQTLHGWQMLLCHNFLSQTILTLIICMCNLLTFFWQTSSLSTSWLPVQQLTLWAGGGHWGCPDCIPIITEGVPSAWIPGGGLPQPSLGLGLQTGFLDVVADGWQQPVPIDLI